MKTFVIDSSNQIHAFVSRDGAHLDQSAAKFTSEKEFAALAADWPARRLVEIWNSLPGARPVRRFTNRQTAVRRIWKAIQERKPSVAKPARTAALKGRGLEKKALRDRSRAVRRDSTKTERVIALLKRPAGATLKAILALTGWQAHSVRGFISAQLTKRMGFRIDSFKRNGERVYQICS
jgi:hypothetical protein